MNALLAHLRRRPPGPAPVADGDLLARYLAVGDEDAFAELVLRHGPVVYAACRRLLPDPADADDAFQAVWLVLVRRAARLAGKPTVGPWLYQVAVWTARNLRRKNAHRLARRAPLADAQPDPSPETASLRLDLDAALLALPEKYRAPVVLCHLHGWSRRDAAAHLGCREGTLSAQLARALARLRKHLAGADAAALLAVAGVALPAGLASAAVRSAAAFRTASLSAAGVSPAVADLTRGVLRMFWMKKLAAGLVLVAVVGTGLGIGYGPRAEAQSAPKAAPPTDDQDARIKQLEDELARLKRARDVVRQQKRDIEELDRLALKQQGPRLELVLGRPMWLGIDDLEVIEYAGGKRVGHVRCSNVKMLTRVLTRARKDPAGPRKLSVQAPSNYPYDKLASAFVACKAAGFDKIMFSGPLPNPGRGIRVTDPETGQERFMPGFNEFPFPVELDLTKSTSLPDWKAPRPSYVIEPPDILRIEAAIRLPAGEGLRALPLQLVHGEYLVRPDGTVSLGAYGSVKVSGLTVAQAVGAVRKHLAGHDSLRDEVTADDLVVILDVSQYNSKWYYVITDGGGAGEQVYRFASTGNETVLHALANVPGLAAKAAAGRVYVVRRADDKEQILPVDWVGISREGVTTTNYQLFPGDRVYIKAK